MSVLGKGVGRRSGNGGQCHGIRREAVTALKEERR